MSENEVSPFILNPLGLLLEKHFHHVLRLLSLRRSSEPHTDCHRFLLYLRLRMLDRFNIQDVVRIPTSASRSRRRDLELGQS